MMRAGIAKMQFPLKSGGGTFPAYPAHVQPAIYVSGKRSMDWCLASSGMARWPQSKAAASRQAGCKVIKRPFKMYSLHTNSFWAYTRSGWECCWNISDRKSRVMKLTDMGGMNPSGYSDQSSWFSNRLMKPTTDNFALINVDLEYVLLVMGDKKLSVFVPTSSLIC